MSGSVPDQKTIWLFREVLIRKGQVKKRFRRFEKHLNEAGLMGHEGKIIESLFADVPRQRNSREENEEIKQGKVPESFQQNENRMEQKDVAAWWAKKGEDVHYGYKNHVKADRTTKLIEDYEVTDASVHDSQAVEDKAQKKRNRKKSKIRVRVEQIFWFMTNTMKDGLKMGWIGMSRITAGIGLVNLVYNLARYEQILRLKLA